MLFTTLRKLKIRKGLTEDLKTKIDVFYALNRLTEKEYSELMDVNKEEEPKAELTDQSITEAITFDVIQEKVKGYGIEYVKKEKLSVEEYEMLYKEEYPGEQR